MGWTTKKFNSYQGGDFSLLQNALMDLEPT
jgi:hypothetical protein